MNKDHETLQYRLPSRSEQRRAALDVLALAGQLVELDSGRLQQLPIPDEIRVHIAQTQRISSHIARKRQLGFLAKQLRRQDETILDAIRDALNTDGETARQDAARLHRVERWRERLLGEGDAALGEFVQLYPDVDRQHLRQLIRQTQTEYQHGKPPRAFRVLFRYLNDALAQSDANNHTPNTGPAE